MHPDLGMAVDRAPLTLGMVLVYTYDGVEEGVSGIGLRRGRLMESKRADQVGNKGLL